MTSQSATRRYQSVNAAGNGRAEDAPVQSVADRRPIERETRHRNRRSKTAEGGVTPPVGHLTRARPGGRLDAAHLHRSIAVRPSSRARHMLVINCCYNGAASLVKQSGWVHLDLDAAAVKRHTATARPSRRRRRAHDRCTDDNHWAIRFRHDLRWRAATATRSTARRRQLRPANHEPPPIHCVPSPWLYYTIISSSHHSITCASNKPHAVSRSRFFRTKDTTW